MKKRNLVVALAAVAALGISACSSTETTETTAAAETVEETTAAEETTEAAEVETEEADKAEASEINYEEAFAQLSEETPMVADNENKTVYYLCEVNGKYFDESTRHGIVYADGSNGEKSVLRGLGDEKEFYNMLAGMGFEEGNNLTKDDMKAKAGTGKAIEGAKLNCTVWWEGADRAYNFDEIVKSSDERPMDLRFGGNLERAEKFNTGCVLCLDSCAVGITSDASYTANEIEGGAVQRYGNADVLPADGTKVMAVFTAAE